MNFCTLFDSTYLYRGLALYESLCRHSDSFHLYVLAMDTLTYRFLSQQHFPHITVISLKEMEDADLLAIKWGRTPGEYCWTCTPSLIRYVIHTYHTPFCIYLDADIYFFNNPAPLIQEWGEADVLITAHRYTTRYDQSSSSGIYCVQFMGFKDTQNGLAVLEWWRQACLNWCFNRVEYGRFGDQKYLDDWPQKFDNVHVLSHLGGGVAPWNIQQYTLTQTEHALQGKERRTGAIFDVIFFHFHGLKVRKNIWPDYGFYRLSISTKKMLYRPYIKTLLELQHTHKNPVLYHKNPLSQENFLSKLCLGLTDSSPFMVCRIGGVEFSCLTAYLQQDRKMVKTFKKGIRDQMAINAGFFPSTQSNLKRVSELYLDSIAKTDAIACWGKPQESDFFHTICPHADLFSLGHLDPFCKKPWTMALEGKTVLVIHPFEKSIQSQFLKREHLFPNNPLTLPSFTLKTLKAVQSIAGCPTSFTTWFEAFDWMCKQMDTIEFDIALIGAGAYGLPLAAYVKSIGKKAVHLGGTTQLLFGIIGKRWEEHAPSIMAMKNEHWVRPLPEETPAFFHKVEGGTYW